MVKRVYFYKNKIIFYIFKVLDFILYFTKKKRCLPKDINKILLIKPDHLGDVLLFTSVLGPIKEKYHNAQVDIIAGSWSDVILQNNPNINKIYKVDHYKLNRGKKSKISKIWIFMTAYFKTLREIRRERYDVVLNFRSDGNNLITLQLLAAAKFNAGFAASGLSSLLDAEIEFKPNIHEIEHFCNLLEVINVHKKQNEIFPFVFTDDKDKAYVKGIISNFNLHDFIIIHPGSGKSDALMSIDLWKSIIKKHQNRQIVFCGTLDEKNLIEDLLELNNTINLLGIFNIPQLIEFYSKSDKIYTVESISAHLASMTNVSTVSFYRTNSDVFRWAPIGKNVEVIKEYKNFLEEDR